MLQYQNEYDEDGKLVFPRPPGDALSEERFLAWKFGRTGFPWIDAIMRQLRVEGWIHHLARHSVAVSVPLQNICGWAANAPPSVFSLEVNVISPGNGGQKCLMVRAFDSAKQPLTVHSHSRMAHRLGSLC